MENFSPSKKLQDSPIKNEEKLKLDLSNITSFDILFDYFNTNIHTPNNFIYELKNFCLESEKHKFQCESNTENLRVSKNSIFAKFNDSKNLYDFQLSMSSLIINFLFFIHNRQYSKKEFSYIKFLFRSFHELKQNNLIMTDLNSIIKNGLLEKIKNDPFELIKTVKYNLIHDLFYCFNYKKYYLKDIKSFNNFLEKINILIEEVRDRKEISLIFTIVALLQEIDSLLNTKNKIKMNDVQNENEEEEFLSNSNINSYKELFNTQINYNDLLDYFFTINNYSSHLDILLDIFKLFPLVIDSKINNILNKNDKNSIKMLSKLIIKKSDFFSKYLQKSTLDILQFYSIKFCFKFLLSQYKEGKNRLINIYYIIKDHSEIVSDLVYVLKKELNKEKQGDLILNGKYTEEDEYELEDKFLEEKNFLKLPENFKKFYISSENDEISKKSIEILEKNIDKEKNELFGVDTEWRSEQYFLELYENSLNNLKKNNCDIIQIASKDCGFILDIKSIEKNDKIKNKILEIFKNKKFIGFGFKTDIKNMQGLFKDLILKNELIELTNIYKNKYKNLCPNLQTLTLELLGKQLDKRDQISDWSLRPLLKNQINYAILDAYVLLILFDKLNEQE